MKHITTIYLRKRLHYLGCLEVGELMEVLKLGECFKWGGGELIKGIEDNFRPMATVIKSSD